MSMSADHAQLVRESAWDADRALPAIPPGSAKEAAAIDRIDALRDEEKARQADTMTSRHKRHERHWRKYA
jgi:hypothetical protein